jgi:toxin ParE1/3/4
MNKHVIIEPEAEADIAQAHDWYEQRREGLGEDFLLCIEAALHVIAERPKSFPLIRKTARRVLIHRFPYAVLFVDRQEYIAVVGVFHSSRNPKTWKKRLR